MNDKNINRNDILLSWLSSVLKMMLFLLIVFGGFRLFFIFYFGNVEQIQSLGKDFTLALLYGARYDLIVIAYLILPIFLLGLLTPIVKSVTFRNFLNFFTRLYFWFVCFLVFAVLAADMGFYLYFQDHINVLIYGIIEDDTKALIETVQKNYPVPVFIGGILLYITLTFMAVKKLLPKMKRKNRIRSGFLTYLGLALVSIGLYAGAIRGGYSEIVLAPKYNDFSSNEFMNMAAVNGFLALERAVQLRSSRQALDFDMAKTLGYKNGINEAFSDYLGLDMSLVKPSEMLPLLKRRTERNQNLENHKPHVVVVVSESFGSYWNQFNSPEFNFLGGLEKHFSDDYYFKNFISGDNGTIGSLMVITSNIPNRPGARFLSESKYLQVPLTSSAHIPYKTNGYETNFLYGGKLGWRDIGKYYKRQNFNNVIGENKIRKKLGLSELEGTEWGLFDEHLFTMIDKILREARRPQFIIALTTSNHPPFEVPKNFKGSTLVVPTELEGQIKREREGFDQRFKAFQYSNYSFSNFLDNIKTTELKDKTVVAMTGDHNFWGYINFEKEQAYEKHLVPLYIYLPQMLRGDGEIDLEKVGSHEDIMTTLYNRTLSNTEYLSFGDDLFSSAESYAINYKIYASSQGCVYKNEDYKWKNKPKIETKASKRYLKSLRRRYRSSLAVSDYYLQRSLEDFREDKDNP